MIKCLEFSGLSGAGKTFLKSQIVTQRKKDGGVIDLETALVEAWVRKNKSSFALRVPYLLPLIKRYVFSIRSRPQLRLKEVARAIKKNPEMWAVIGDVCLDNQQCEPAEGIFSLFSLVSNLGLSKPRIGRSDLLILDEGFCHKSLPLFGFANELPDAEDRIEKYLNVIPRPDHLIVVETDIGECVRRLNIRGWPKRFQRLEAKERTRVLEQQEGVLEELVRLARDIGVPVTVVQSEDEAALSRCTKVVDSLRQKG